MSDESNFKVGDFVYYQQGEIGKICHVAIKDDGTPKYQIRYCQDKDLSSGPRGGSGPVWREGYPKPVTDPADVLYVCAEKERERLKQLDRQAQEAQERFEALRLARDIIEQSQARAESEGEGE